jgi:hypothetical protein
MSTTPPPTSTSSPPASSAGASKKTETMSTTPPPKQPPQKQDPTISTTVTTTSSKSKTTVQDDDHKTSDRIKASDASKSIPTYNTNLVEEPLSIPQITSNYFCFDCGAIWTTMEDKEQHLIIETERRKNEQLTIEE